MKNISENHIRISAGEKQIQILYRLFSRKQEDGFTHYGISAENEETGERLTIPDITVGWEEAQTLYDSLLGGQVTTITFRDVVEDFLGTM